jgi:hypothetical protein
LIFKDEFVRHPAFWRDGETSLASLRNGEAGQNLKEILTGRL